jgi:hypothetical protein
MSTLFSRNVKSMARLTRADLAAHPVWQYVAEPGEPEQDESYVFPTELQTIPKESGYQQYLVAAVAVLRDGTEFPACVELTWHGRQLSCVPLWVFLLGRQLDFVGVDTDRLLSRYTRYPANRPKAWRLATLVEGERKVRSGKVRRTLLYLFTSTLLNMAMRHFDKKRQ